MIRIKYGKGFCTDRRFSLAQLFWTGSLWAKKELLAGLGFRIFLLLIRISTLLRGIEECLECKTSPQSFMHFPFFTYNSKTMQQYRGKLRQNKVFSTFYSKRNENCNSRYDNLTHANSIIAVAPPQCPCLVPLGHNKLLCLMTK